MASQKEKNNCWLWLDTSGFLPCQQKKSYTIIRDTTWPTWPELHLSCFIWRKTGMISSVIFPWHLYQSSFNKWCCATTHPQLSPNCENASSMTDVLENNAFHPKKTRNNLFNSTTKNNNQKPTCKIRIFPEKIAEICPSPSFFSASSFSAFSFCPGTGWPQTVEIDRRFFLHHGQPGSDYLALKIHYYSNYSTCKNTPSHPPPRKKEKKLSNAWYMFAFFPRSMSFHPA